MSAVAFLTCGLNFLYKKLDKSDNDYTKKFNDVPYNIKICNFGSSHGVDDFNYCDVNNEVCFNFALRSQSLSYDLRVLKNYSERLAEGGTAYIVVSFFSLFGCDETEQENFLSLNKRYYDFLPKKLIKEYSFKERFYRFFPSLTKGSEVFSVFFSKNENDITWQEMADPVKVSMDAKYAYERHIITNKIDENGDRIYNKEEIDALIEMIKLLKEKGVEPILVTTPYMKEYMELVKNNESFLKDFYGVINEITSTLSVKYLDYSTDERFINDYYLFRNSDHLNKEGARIFTDILIGDTIG